jgi:hypothetical protein
MTLQIAQNNLLLFFTDPQLYDLGINRVVFEFMNELVVCDGNHGGISIATINDCWYQALVSQAAARTFPRVRAQFSIQMYNF